MTLKKFFSRRELSIRLTLAAMILGWVWFAPSVAIADPIDSSGDAQAMQTGEPKLPVSGAAEPEGGIVKAPFETKVTLSAARVQFAAPAIADLDKDAYQEIIIGTSDGWVFAVKPVPPSGQTLWSFNTTGAFNARAYTQSGTTIRGAPAIADLDRDGWNEVIVPVGTVPEDSQNGGMIVLSHDGKLLPGWPQLTFDKYGSAYTEGIAQAPATADLDGDGDLEILAGSFDHRIYAWHHDGSWVKGWPRHVYDTVWSSPIVGDLDRDGLPEVVVGADAHSDPYFGSIDGGAVYVFRHDGRLMSGFPKYVEQNIESVPVLADLDADGYLDIIIGGGSFYNHGSAGFKAYAWDRFGNSLPGWPVSTGGNVTGSPAVADLDRDGKLEVVVGSWDHKVYAWRHTGQLLPGWPMTPKMFLGNTYQMKSAVVADIDRGANADGKPEVLVTCAWEVTLVNASGTQLTWDGTSGNPQNRVTYLSDYTLDATPAVADIDNDGKLELVAAGGDGSDQVTGGRATIYVWQLAQSQASDGTRDWPMLKRDASRIGTLGLRPADDAAVARHTLPSLWRPNQQKQLHVVMRNTGTTTWTAAAGYALRSASSAFYGASRIDLPAGTSVAPGQEATFTFTAAAPASQGFYAMDWRMVKSGQEFGQRIAFDVKVGSDPMIYVLRAARADSGGGVYPSGLASSIAPPHNYGYWEWARALVLTSDRRGYYVLDESGYFAWAGTAPDIGSVGSAPAVAMVAGPDKQALLVMDAYGRLSLSSGAMGISPPPPTFGEHQVRSFAVTPDYKGLYVLDRFGRVYTAGTARPLSPATPVFADAIAVKIKLTPDASGFYVLDRYGRVHAGGAAPTILPSFTPHEGEDWARDFELTEDGLGYYLLDKYGGVHAGGTAASPAGADAVTHPDGYWADGSAIDLELGDGRYVQAPLLAPETTQVILPGDVSRAPLPVRIRLTNNGTSDPLNWSARVEPSVSWLRISPTKGSTPAIIELSVTAALPVGSHTTSVRFDATDSAGQPVETIAVSVTAWIVPALKKAHLPMVLGQ